MRPPITFSVVSAGQLTVELFSFGLPTILTTSFESGPNGPIVPELKELFPEAPHIARPGQIIAWDNEDFVKAVKDTGKKQLIIVGVVTEVCVAFPALSAIEEGCEVFVITDASGPFIQTTRDAAWSRMAAAGVQLMSWFGMACELHRDWRNDMEGLASGTTTSIPWALIHTLSPRIYFFAIFRARFGFPCRINKVNAGERPRLGITQVNGRSRARCPP